MVCFSTDNLEREYVYIVGTYKCKSRNVEVIVSLCFGYLIVSKVLLDHTFQFIPGCFRDKECFRDKMTLILWLTMWEGVSICGSRCIVYLEKDR